LLRFLPASDLGVIPIQAMTRKRQKLAEMKVVQLFHNAGGLGINADLLFVSDHLERPDIIAKTDKETVGIEIRRLYNDEQEGSGSVDRKRHGIYQSVVAACSELHSRRSDKWIVVRLSFSKHADIDQIAKRRSGIKQEIAEKLVSLIEDLPLSIGDSFDLRSEDLWGSHWPEGIDSVHGVLLEGNGPPEWDFSDSFWVAETTDEIIQTALDEKEQKVDSWRDSYDSAWVILVLDGSVGASMLRLHRQLIDSEYLSSFDRAFIMEFTGTRYKELRLRSS
jgi:hypothetical protein